MRLSFALFFFLLRNKVIVSPLSCRKPPFKQPGYGTAPVDTVDKSANVPWMHRPNAFCVQLSIPLLLMRATCDFWFRSDIPTPCLSNLDRVSWRIFWVDLTPRLRTILYFICFFFNFICTAQCVNHIQPRILRTQPKLTRLCDWGRYQAARDVNGLAKRSRAVWSVHLSVCDPHD